MKLLDLYCGGGGAAKGYADVGFEVTGVDVVDHPRYPYNFIQADASWLSQDFLREFDVIHASPPCKAHTVLAHIHKRGHEDLVPITREMLQASGKPYIIENVPGAPLIDPAILCGTQFGLSVEVSGRTWWLRRHRLFESNWGINPPESCVCNDGRSILGVYGHGGNNEHPERRNSGNQASAPQARALIQAGWMSRSELAQSIPPAYTEYIGRQLLNRMEIGLLL